MAVKDVVMEEEEPCASTTVPMLLLLLRRLLLVALLAAHARVLPPSLISAEAAAVPCGCDSMAVYTVGTGDTLFIISHRFQVTDFRTIQNLNNISNPNKIPQNMQLRIPFSCDCPSSDQAGALPSHTFLYTVIDGDEDNIVASYYGNLTTVGAIAGANTIDINDLMQGQVLRIPVNCSCSESYGLFGTYAAQPNDTLSSLSSHFGISQQLLRQYNPTVSFDPLQPFSIMYIPLRDSSGRFPPLKASAPSAAGGGKLSPGIIAAVAVGGIVFFLAFALGVWFLWPRCRRQSQFKRTRTHDHFTELAGDAFIPQSKPNKNASSENWSSKHGAPAVDHCINFSLDELAAATDNFSLSKQIGKGGYGAVYYGEWQDKKMAVKKMDMKEQKEFTNEMRILSSVHHANLVDLLGYCTENYLFLVYEFVDNGTLAHHLRSKTNPMAWTTRVQIALDAARGIEYMHEHTQPTFIHRDLKPNNILIDSEFHAKVGDFGLTRFLDPDGDGFTKTLSRYGTFGYMAPEYAQFGHISKKVDVFAFGIILLQIISGREAMSGATGLLQDLFEAALERGTAEEDEFERLVDPALGDEYPIESVWKMAQLAVRCTDKQPEQRPQMREVVIQLMMIANSDLTQTQGN